MQLSRALLDLGIMHVSLRSGNSERTLQVPAEYHSVQPLALEGVGVRGARVIPDSAVNPSSPENA